MQRIYTYVVRYDIGFAPNPYFGICTLATCKPGIRKGARVGDLIAGIGSKPKGQWGQLVFGMRVTEAMSFDQYWADARFERKKTNRSGSVKQRYGDNIYHRPDGENWVQEDGRHSLSDGTANMGHVKRDTGSPRVLVSNEFVYFGANAVPIPTYLRDWGGFDFCLHLRDYRYNYPEGLGEAYAAWLEPLLGAGLEGEPMDW